MLKNGIQKCTIEDLEKEPNFVALVAEYAAESAVLGLPAPKGKIELYKIAEKNGVAQAYAAWIENLLIGFLVVLSPINLHYGICLATTESIFIGAEYRQTGSGRKLIRMAEQRAQEVNSPGHLMSAPPGSDLAEILPYMGYELAGLVFFKNFNKVMTKTDNRLPAMNKEAVAKVYKLEEFTKKLLQVDIATSHSLHGGLYARTIKIPAGVRLTGALIKIPTTLIVVGDVIVYTGEDVKELAGHNILAAEANRKQIFVARTDTYLTMVFPTRARTLAEAEEEFTDEAHLLASRKTGAINTFIEEAKCLAQ